ncbi:hypothetical protein F5Y04DRAFT_287297 [Hypomontagnella monticulosa]|nr:hypothetical protein F5Y04DRAFT_287297 [Hypomontagnella monticulosa]
MPEHQQPPSQVIVHSWSIEPIIYAWACFALFLVGLAIFGWGSYTNEKAGMILANAKKEIADNGQSPPRLEAVNDQGLRALRDEFASFSGKISKRLRRLERQRATIGNKLNKAIEGVAGTRAELSNLRQDLEDRGWLGTDTGKEREMPKELMTLIQQINTRLSLEESNLEEMKQMMRGV